MDWKLSKSIYIVVFFIINIVLLIVLYNQNQSYDRIETSKNKLITESEDYKTNVDSIKQLELSVLNGVQQSFQEDIKAENPTESNQFKTTKDLRDISFEASEVKEEIDKEMYKGSEYTYNNLTSTEENMYFNQMYDALPIFNNSAARIKATKTNDNTIRLEQGYIKDIAVNEYSQSVKVIDPITLAEDLVKEKVVSKDAVVNSATLGYYLILLNDKNQQVLLRPKWKLEIEESDITRIIYVDAINASEEIIEGE